MDNKNLNQKIYQQTEQITPASFEQTIANWFKLNKRKMSTMAGNLETAQQMVVALTQTASRNPKIMQCVPETIFTCLMNSAFTRLFPGPLLECAYVPFFNGKARRLEATWMPMYGGLCKLAYNSGHVRSIFSSVVYEADEFDYELGSSPFIRHRPFLGSYADRGDRVCAYSAIETLHGRVLTIKSMDFIEAIKKRSPASKSSDSPWNGSTDDYDAMACKTVLKQGLKTVPKSAVLASALDLDMSDKSDIEDRNTTSNVFDGMVSAERVASYATAPSANASSEVPSWVTEDDEPAVVAPPPPPQVKQAPAELPPPDPDREKRATFVKQFGVDSNKVYDKVEVAPQLHNKISHGSPRD